MACFTATVAEAVIVSAAKKIVKSKEKTDSSEGKIPFSRKLGWLSNMLWGGSALLAFEHIWHGEVVPYFPFLTAAENPDTCREMIHEILTAGVFMAVLVTAVWLGILAVVHIWEKKTAPGTEAAK